jgi:hypothetical protein
LADKLFKVGNGSAWYERPVYAMNGAGKHERTVKVGNGSSWYVNYPRIKEYSAYFGCTWTQGYNKSNTHLWDPTWGDKIYVGGADGFKSLIGFDKNAIQAFVAGGYITQVVLLINLEGTSLNGHPTVNFLPHAYTSEPTVWDDWYLNEAYTTQYTFPNDSDSPGLGGWWKTLTPNHIIQPTTGNYFSGIALKPATNTEEDWGVFTGKSGFNSQLKIFVMK